jgi:hypothetical protein
MLKYLLSKLPKTKTGRERVFAIVGQIQAQIDELELGIQELSEENEAVGMQIYRLEVEQNELDCITNTGTVLRDNLRNFIES